MATLTKEDNKNYIREIQSYLRGIAYYDERIPFIAVDGIYGQKTAAAVGAFQTVAGLPATGDVDKATFDALVKEYERVFAKNGKALEINGFPDPKKTLMPGDTGYDVYFLQVMLKALGDRFDNIYSVDINGKYDAATAEAVNGVKRAAGINSEGTDKRTWDEITRLYNSL